MRKTRVFSLHLFLTDDVQSLMGLKCPLFISQNDGTVRDLDAARHFPVFTFASGMRVVCAEFLRCYATKYAPQ